MTAGSPIADDMRAGPAASSVSGASGGSGFLAGLDEAGRGCLAGPVVAAAVILPASYDLPGLTDSKKLTPKKRAGLAVMIKAQAASWSLGVIWPLEIDRINILQASLLAMARAAARLKLPPGALRIDGNKTIPRRYLPGILADVPQEALVGGDLLDPRVSAASILAKTFRDHLMEKLDRRYPGYGFAVHKGYGVAEHLAAIKANGPCRMHRMTFRGVLPEDERLAAKGLPVQGRLPGL